MRTSPLRIIYAITFLWISFFLSSSFTPLPNNNQPKLSFIMAIDEEQEYTTNAEDQAKAAALQQRLREHTAASTQGTGQKLPHVEIARGKHKYVLIRAEFDGHTEYIVTSKQGAHYHRNAAEPMVHKLQEAGYYDIDVVGGGRIDYDPAAKKIFIYGYSYGFGRADHSISQQVVQEDERYKDYEVTWSNDGY